MAIHLSPPLTTAPADAENINILNQGEKVDLTLLDIMMPGMTGYEVCSDPQKRITIKQWPILFLTGKTTEQDLATGFSLGGSDFLIKPAVKGEVLA